jgi:preprotein translocase subunit SecG
MLELLHTPLTVLHALVCFMVMLVVLIQPGKSGGLGAALGGAGAQQIFGGRGAGNFLTRTTWIAASVFFVTSITLAYMSTSTGDSLEALGKHSSPKADSTETAPAPAGEPAPSPGGEPAQGASDPAPSGSPAPGSPAPGSPAPGSPAPSDSPAAPAAPSNP